MNLSSKGAAIMGIVFLAFWFWWGMNPLRPLPLLCGVGLIVLSVYVGLRRSPVEVSMAVPLAILAATTVLGIVPQVLLGEVFPSFWLFLAFCAVIVYAAHLNARDSGAVVKRDPGDNA